MRPAVGEVTGFGADAQALADASGRADVVLRSPGLAAPEGWLRRIAAAAAADTNVACAVPITGPRGAVLDAPPVHPRVLGVAPPLIYVRRSAIDLCGPLDEDFPARCLRAGLVHVLADDLVVPGPILIEDGDRLGAEARARRLARVRLSRPAVTVDARSLTERVTGTQVHTLELLRALHAFGDVDLRVIVPDAVGAHAASVLEEVAAERVTYEAIRHGGVSRSDVVHRPYQVTSHDDIGVLGLCGERVVITHQDLIAYRNPGYHATPEDWRHHRRHTREALGFADLVVFESAHALEDAVADDLVARHRARLIPIGADHVSAAAPERPEGVGERPFLLCLGTDYRHKNRVFAMRLLAALRERGWDGSLVLAGPEVQFGGTAEDERAWLAGNPDVPVVELAAVSEGEKAWLYANAAAVAYPTTYEGFGLIPFEAAAHGTPCLWAPVASLSDVLPAELAVLQPWDAEASADRVLPVLRDPQAHVAAVREVAQRYTWRATAEALREVYLQALELPARLASTAAADALAGELARAEWEARYWGLREDIGPTGLSLVEPPGRLLDEEAQRTLAALARRPATRRPLMAALRGLRRLGGG